MGCPHSSGSAKKLIRHKSLMHEIDRLAKIVAESSSPFDGGKIEGNNGLNANEENKIDTLASEKNTAEEYEMEGRIESSKDEEESTTQYKSDDQEAIEESETIYDAKEENILFNGNSEKEKENGEKELQKQSSKDEKERTTPDAQMAIKDSVTIYDTTEENTFNDNSKKEEDKE